MSIRKVKLRGLNDGYVFDFVDDGADRDGDPYPGRARLLRALDTRVDLGGGDSLPAFALAEPPAFDLPPEDALAKKLKDDDGKWKKPTKLWTEECARRVERREARARAASGAVAAQSGKTIMDALTRAVNANAAAPVVEVKP
jgi:hypothetical protein